MWHSVTSDNLGVGALTESQLHLVEACADRLRIKCNYIVFGTQGGLNYRPNSVQLRQGARLSIKQLLLGRTEYLRDVSTCDVVLDIGEGDSFADIYGTRRFVFLLLSKILVLLKGRPLILSPQTIGPFDRWWARRLAFSTMRRCARVFARDVQSAQYLRENGLTGNSDEAIDVAFQLPYVRDFLPPTTNIRIGLNVSGLLMSGGYTRDNQFKLTVDYRALIYNLLAEWSSNPDVEIWLIPHVLSTRSIEEDDRRAINEVLYRYPQCKVVYGLTSPSEAKSVLAAMDFVTAGRMHACIAAFSTGVPVVPFSYSRKFNGLFSSLHYPWVVDGRSATIEEAQELIVDGFRRRGELAKLVVQGNELARQRLSNYETYLLKVIDEVSSVPAIVREANA